MFPTLFSLEIPFLDLTLEPRFYGLFYAIAILIGSRIVLSEVQRRELGLSDDDAMNLTLYAFLVGLLGARTYEGQLLRASTLLEGVCRLAGRACHPRGYHRR